MLQCVKDPQAKLDYAVDWADWLGADTISAVVWTIDAGLTLESQSNTTTDARVWLSGGTLGAVYKAVCRITTAAGRIDERTIQITMRNR